MDLLNKKCVPCEGGIPPLNHDQIQEFLSQLEQKWEVENDQKISRVFAFRNFKFTMAFVMKLALLAEEEGHHPDLHVSWGKVKVELWTHAIEGLSENDFILAKKIEQL